ncbi:MAG: Rieske 2Fe-2S domain-containing protein [Gammaproteobacteria bacterium]
MLIDRCCHRGARLSLGTVTDGHLACGYHGWRYDRSSISPRLQDDRTFPRGMKLSHSGVWGEMVMCGSGWAHLLPSTRRCPVSQNFNAIVGGKGQWPWAVTQ